MTEQEVLPDPGLLNPVELPKKVIVKGLRIFENIRIDAEPTVPGKPATIWRFFSTLVDGDDQQKIKSICIRPAPAGPASCSCETDGRDRLKTHCRCGDGASGTITFHTADGISALIANLRTHAQNHPHGYLLTQDRGEDGYINFCSGCCLFNRQVLHHKNRVSVGDTGQWTLPGDLVDKIIEPGRIKAITAILSSMLQGYSCSDVRSLGHAIAGNTMAEAGDKIRDGAARLLRDKSLLANPTGEFIFIDWYQQVMTSPLAEVMGLAYKVTDALFTTCAGFPGTFVEECSKQHAPDQRDALIRGLRVAVSAGATPPPASSPRRPPRQPSPRGQPVSEQTRALETRIEQRLNRMQRLLADNPVSDLRDRSGSLYVLDALVQRIDRIHGDLSDIFEGTEITSELEAKHRPNYQSLTARKNELLCYISAEIRRAGQDLGNVRDHDERSLPPRSYETSREQDLPSGEEIDHETDLIGQLLHLVDEGESRCREMLDDPEVGRKQHEFLDILQGVIPRGTKQLKDLRKMCTTALKWLKQTNREMTPERRGLLWDRVERVRRAELLWQELALQANSIDRTHGFSQGNGGAGVSLRRQTLDPYYGEAEGKPFQNLLEWITDLEDKVLRHFPNQHDKVLHAMDHLSPKISAVAKPHDFRSYQELKAWLFSLYLNEKKILDSWVARLVRTGSTRHNMTSAEVGLYVTEVQGTLKQILSCTAHAADLKGRLFTRQTVAFLGRTILTPLNKPTGENQWHKFSTEVVPRLPTDIGGEVNPTAMFNAIEVRLEEIRVDEKAHADLNEDALRGGIGRSKAGTSEFLRKVQNNIELLLEDGQDHEDVYREAVLLAQGQCNQDPANGSGDTLPHLPGGSGGGGRLDSASIHVSVMTSPLNHTWGRGYDVHQVTKTGGQGLSPGAGQVLVNQESLEQARRWHAQFKLRCWVCPNHAPAHEFAGCKSALETSQKARYNAARDPKQGPGLQCFSCLDGMCFVKRCLEQGVAGQRGRLPMCSKNTALTDCQQCLREISSSPKKKGQLKPFHALICRIVGHIKVVDLPTVIHKMIGIYGEGMTELRVFPIYDLASSMGQGTGNFDAGTTGSNDRGTVKDSDIFQSDSSDDDEDGRTGPGVYRAKPGGRHYVDSSEYPDTYGPMVMDTTDGTSVKFDASSMDDRVVSEKAGVAVYFMQQLRLGDRVILCFYDTGAQMSLIQTKLARHLRLPMINREGFHLVGAGEHVTRTTDGTYDLVLGKGPEGEIYRFSVSGMKKLTGTMLQCEWTSIHDEVRARSEALASKYPCFEGLGFCLKQGETLPPATGGTDVQLLIGLKLPALQPTVIFSMPSGILVARAKLYDVYHSNIVFGGMSQAYNDHFKASYAQFTGARKCSYYEAYNRHCFSEYITFRDSIYPDKISVSWDEEGQVQDVQVQQWVEACEEEEEDFDLDDRPFIIAGYEKKRSTLLYQEQFYQAMELEDEEELSARLGQQPISQIHQHLHVNSPAEGEELDDSPTTDVVLFNGEELNPYVYGKPETILKDGADMVYAYRAYFGQAEPYEVTGESALYSCNLPYGRLAKRIDRAVGTCFGSPYGDGLLTGLNQSDFSTEEVLFEHEDDRIASIHSIVPDLELCTLIWRQTGLLIHKQAPDMSSVGGRGMQAFLAAAPPDWEYVPPVHDCDTCTCSVNGVWEDSIPDDDVPLFNSRGINKLRSMIRKWEDDEDIGTTVSFRCPRCQDCPDCLRSGRTRARSIREDDEQAIIEASVHIDYEAAKTTVTLPFIKPPAELAVKFGADSNFKQAKAFITRMGKASADIRKALTAFWLELEHRNVVVKLSDLPVDLQKSIVSAPIKHFYPWNFVQKPGSTSTPVRIVMDSRSSGFNEWLAKGINSLNNLQTLVLLWRTFLACGTFDISKMYNMLHIAPAHLCYQLVLWRDKMDPANPIEIWVITRAIYGTVSSGNQAEVAIRRGAARFKDELPEGAYTITHETYVGDGMPGRNDPKQLKVALEEVQTILERIGFNLKCTVVSGQKDLSPKASNDGINVSIAGYNWKPHLDKLSLAVKECNFAPIIRGAKKPNPHAVHSGKDITSDIFPSSLTRAQVVGKVAELFDPNGLWMPITMLGKILCRRYTHLAWKDPIPDKDLEEWLDFVKLVQDTRGLEIDRCVISPDSVGKVELLEVNDGSQHGCAAAVYLRTQLTDKSYSSRLLFSRSALCPPDQSIPRNELAGAHLGAATIYVVKSAMKDRIGSMSAFTDSCVVMCWLCNPQLKLKNWVMARVKEIKRVTEGVSFWWVKGEVNIADLATKGTVSIDDVTDKSAWQIGPSWMHEDLELARDKEIIRTYEDVMLKLDAKEQKALAEEQHPSLPDLVNGDRRGGNSELDADTLQYSTRSLEEANMFQIIDFRRPDVAAPESVLVGGVGHVYCTEPRDLSPLVVLQINHSGVSRAFQEVPSYFYPCTPRSKLPANQQTIEFPEEHSLLPLGWGPEQIRSVLVSYPANYYLTPGGVNTNAIKLSSYVVDPIYYGFRRSFRTTTVFIHFKNKLVHRTHQLPSDGHHLQGKLSETQVAIRVGLAGKCVICKTLPVNFKGANLAYLDHLTTGFATVTEMDNLRRTKGESVWRPRFVLYAHDLSRPSPQVLASRAQLFLDSRVNVRTRTMARDGIDSRHGTRKKRPVETPRVKSKLGDTPAILDSTVEIDDTTRVQTWQYFMRKCSQEVSDTLDSKDKKMFTFCQDGVWRYFGRLKEREQIEHRDIELDRFFDSDKISFVHPVGLANSPFVYTLVMDIHWRVHPHRGVYSTNRVLSNIMHVVKGGTLTRAIREDCLRCRRALKKTMAEMMGDIPLEKLIISPAFYAVQIDDCGPFKAHSRHGQRSVLKVNALVITCINTSAVSIWVLETQEAPSVLKAILRHSYRYGYPAIAYIDLGPGLVKGAKHEVEVSNYSTILRQSCGMRVIPKPPQAHAQRGKVERVVKSLKQWVQDEKLCTLTQSILDWETTFAHVSNFFNNLPMARLSKNRSLTTDLNDIVTPNRLLLGRNNQRSPTFVAGFDSDAQQFEKRLLKNGRINRTWYGLLLKMVPDLVFRPKWFDDTIHKPLVGDYVLFRLTESTMGPEHNVWRIALVIKITGSECSTTAVYHLSYQCAVRRKNKKPVDWPIERHETTRSCRELVLLMTEEEISSPPGSDSHRRRGLTTDRDKNQKTRVGHQEM